MHQSEDLKPGEASKWDKLTVEGSFTATDRDTDDATNLFIEKKPDGSEVEQVGDRFVVKGTYGAYTITPTPAADGAGTKFSYTYKLNNTTSNYDGAASDKVTFLIADGHGGTVEKSLTVDLSAENAKPTFEEDEATHTAKDAATHVVVEDSNNGVPLVSGTVPAVDGDTAHLGGSSALSYAIVGDSGTGMYQGKYGTLFLTADGTYTYKLNNNDPRVQALREGEELKGEQFTIRVSDSRRENETPKSSDFTVNISVSGTNDAPSITLHAAANGPKADNTDSFAVQVNAGDLAPVFLAAAAVNKSCLARHHAATA